MDIAATSNKSVNFGVSFAKDVTNHERSMMRFRFCTHDLTSSGIFTLSDVIENIVIETPELRKKFDEKRIECRVLLQQNGCSYRENILIAKYVKVKNIEADSTYVVLPTRTKRRPSGEAKGESRTTKRTKRDPDLADNPVEDEDILSMVTPKIPQSFRSKRSAVEVTLEENSKPWLSRILSLEQFKRCLSSVRPSLQAKTKQERRTHGKSLDSSFLSLGNECLSFVCIVKNSGGKSIGTGYLISQHLMMTCEHVLDSENIDTHNLPIVFNYRSIDHQVSSPNTINILPVTAELKPDKFLYINKKLDFAIVAVDIRKPGDADMQQRFGSLQFCTRVNKTDRTSISGKHVNVIGHPDGKPLTISIRNNMAFSNPRKELLMMMDDDLVNQSSLEIHVHVVLHEADTDGGSSGSPMFNDEWELVAMHLGCSLESKQIQLFSNNNQIIPNYGVLLKYILQDIYSAKDKQNTSFEDMFMEKDRDTRMWLGIPFKKYSKKLKF